MNFAPHFPALESLADAKLAGSDSGMTSTKEIAAFTGLQPDEAVGSYEAYNKEKSKRFYFEREFGRDHAAFDWNVTIKRTVRAD